MKLISNIDMTRRIDVYLEVRRYIHKWKNIDIFDTTGSTIYDDFFAGSINVNNMCDWEWWTLFAEIVI